MNETTRNEIIRRWQAGMSRRAIAGELGISRDRVSRVLRGHERDRSAAGPPPPATSRGSSLDVHRELVDSLLARYPDITAVRVHEELRARGFSGRYTIVRDLVRRLRPRDAPRPVVRFETTPGAQAQMDYGVYDLDFLEEGRRRVNLFSYVLGYSRRQYLRFVESQDMATTLREHVRAFEHLGGVAATCLYDNMKVVVARHEDGEPIYNTRFLAFATYYAFRPWACRPRRPQTKGKVERPFHFVELNLLNGREFRSLAHLNEVAERWLAEVADTRVHRETGRRPLDLHAQERSFLIPLPQRPYDTAEVVYRAVDAEGCVAYRQNRYSVPWRFIGQALPLRITEQEVVIYGPEIREVARHELFPRTVTGQRRVNAAHRPGDDRRGKEAFVKERFAELGPTASRFLEGLLGAKRCGWDQAQRVLALLGMYRQSDLLSALERAARYGAFSLASVERILAAEARPKPPAESWIDEERQRLRETLADPPVSPRPTSEYQSLLSDEQPHHAPPTPAETRDINNAAKEVSDHGGEEGFPGDPGPASGA